MDPKIVYCITCKGRAQHIEKTLPLNILDNEGYPNAKFVLLDYNSQDNLSGWVRATRLIDQGKLVVYSFPEAESFKMAHAKNMAHRLGILEGADILVNLDADNFTEPGFASYIAQEFKKNKDIFLWARMIKDKEGRLPRGISGRIAVSRHAFLNAGGYDEKYDTWGPDDKDFTARLRRLGYQAQEIDPKYLRAILHNDRMRFKEYQHVQAITGEDSFEVDAATTIANYGKFGMGMVYRNFDFSRPIVLGEVPTRVFGIGMHKTGTTSLHTALSTLGFDSAHWKSAHWAKAIWKELTTTGKSPTLEKSYAVCDLPMTFLYKELDAAYPGSKFILTTRSENKWIRSVRNHWDPERNKYRRGWNKDAFTHRAHKLLYGQRGFEEGLFLERFRRHNAEVIEYFKNRPGDILVMDMDRKAGWHRLCGFLGQPIPSVAYPVAFQTPETLEEALAKSWFQRMMDFLRNIGRRIKHWSETR